MRSYLNMLQYILDNGERKTNRTGIDTIAVFGYQFDHDLRKGFPLLTTKRIFTKAVFHEMLWFLQGSANIKYLNENGVRIWDEWADDHGDLGPVYGTQWRKWAGLSEGSDNVVIVDQIKTVIENIKKDPFSRRHIVTAWNPAEVDIMALPPCHLMFQFHVNNDKELSCHMYMRSADVFLGVPFNIASYALLTHMVSQVTGLGVGNLIVSFGDLHVYVNHFDQIKTQMARQPLVLPKLILNPRIKDIDDFAYDDIALEGYNPWGTIKGEVAV